MRLNLEYSSQPKRDTNAAFSPNLVTWCKSSPWFISSAIICLCLCHFHIVAELDYLSFLELFNRGTKTQLKTSACK